MKKNRVAATVETLLKEMSPTIAPIIQPRKPQSRTRVEEGFEFTSGFYIAYAKTAAGKSVGLIALALHVNGIRVESADDREGLYIISYPDGDESKRLVSALYIPVNERQGIGVNTAPAQSTAQAILSADLGYLSVEGRADGSGIDISPYLGPWMAIKDRMRMVIIDSMATELRAWVPSANPTLRKDSSAMSKGLQLADTIACLVHNQLGLDSNTAIIGVVNVQLMPVLTELAGACEGIITIEEDAGGQIILTKADSTSGRADRIWAVPGPLQSFAAHVLGYPGRASEGDAIVKVASDTYLKSLGIGAL